MPLTLEEYAEYLDKRADLSWPTPPAIQPRKAKPFLTKLPGIRAVLWGCYGVLVAISGGELIWLPEDEFLTELAFDKLVREFKLWQAMTRKPGNPAMQLCAIYRQALEELQFQAGGRDRYPEVRADKVWESVFRKLKPSEFSFDPLFYGDLPEFCLKVAYFYQRSIQATQGMPHAWSAIEQVSEYVDFQGILADGQAFSWLHLKRGLQEQGLSEPLEDFLPTAYQVWSYQVGARKPSERLFRDMAQRLEHAGVEPHEVLYVGCNVEADVAPARRLGWRTALFVGDKAAVRARNSQFNDPKSRPDLLCTELTQIVECLASS
ncbi:MAG: HAD family hydrolase [Gemmatales bacterium]|nr:HAD family hydrolase [Gemmatales bacterium]MDW7994345.1 HAD family hydrolase [Gemmatales bacterium]